MRRPTPRVRTERIKLTANYLNGLAIALAAVGSFSPFVSTTIRQGQMGLFDLLVVGGCISASAVLHWIARRVLRGLDDDA